MAELVADRVNKALRDHLEGAINDREFRALIQDFSADELNELVEFIRALAISPPQHAQIR